MADFSVFKITDGDISADLRKLGLYAWVRTITQPKGGGYWQDSPLADGRKLIMRKMSTVIEEYRISPSAENDDILAMEMRNLRTLLDAANEYWEDEYNTRKVWLEVRHQCETNSRYAMIHFWSTPTDGDRFILQQASLADVSVLIERGQWLENEPGTGTCVPVSGYSDQLYKTEHSDYAISIYNSGGTRGSINIGSAADIDNLPSADFWTEFTLRVFPQAGTPAGYIFYKSANFYCRLAIDGISSGVYIEVYAAHATTAAISRGGLGEFGRQIDPVADWKTIAISWDVTSKIFSIYIDGVEVNYLTQQAGVGAYSGDAAVNMYWGNNAASGVNGIPGAFDSIMIEAGNEIPSPYNHVTLCTKYVVTANTVRYYPIKWGSGATVYNIASGGANGALTSIEWLGVECRKLGYTGDECLIDGLDCEHGYINIGSAASVDDLPTGTFAFEMWIKLPRDTLAPTVVMPLVSKTDNLLAPTLGWCFYIVNTGVPALVAEAVFGTTNAYAEYNWPFFDGSLFDGEWHHVAVWFGLMQLTPPIGPAVTRFMFAVDGNLIETQAEYNSLVAAVGAYVSDAANNLYLLGDPVSGAYYYGEAGWVRHFNVSPIWAADFTPEDRCQIPQTGTVYGRVVTAIWVYDDTGLTTYNFVAPGTNDGTITGLSWICVCEDDSVLGCDFGAYVTNKRQMSNLTHVYYWDSAAGAWSPNLANLAGGFDLLPAAPVANDFIIFGVDTATPKARGPFDNVVLDLFAATGITGWTWIYGDAATVNPLAWNTLLTIDNTSKFTLFDQDGIGSVHFDPYQTPTAWSAVNPNPGVALGITALWIGVKVTAVSSPTPPAQQNRKIYSIAWPYFEISADEIKGGIPALARHIFRSVSDGSWLTGASYPNGTITRVLIGMRSVNRGDEFVSHINLADEQNPVGIEVVSVSARGTFQTNIKSPTGRVFQYNAPGVSALAEFGRATIYPTTCNHFKGEYKLLVRAEHTAGTATDTTFKLVIDTGFLGSITLYESDEKAGVTIASGLQTYEFDGIKLSGNIGRIDQNDLMSKITFRLYASCSNAAGATIQFYDIILIPSDELLVDTSNPEDNVFAYHGMPIDLDSVSYPKRDISAHIRESYNFDQILYDYKISAVQPIYLPLKKAVRIYVYFETDDATSVQADCWACASIESEKNQRYYSARGSE